MTESVGKCGVIYQASKGLVGDSGVGQALEFPIKPLTKRKKGSPQRIYKVRFFSVISTLLIILSVIGFVFTYGPIVSVEVGYRLSQTAEQTTQPKGGFAGLLAEKLLGSSEGVPDAAFSILIPKIRAKSKVIADVDPADEAEYQQALKLGVAHAKGTMFPGEEGNIYFFAHSTNSSLNAIRLNAVFYLLRELEAEDEVVVIYHGVKHRYVVIDKKIVEPADVFYLQASNGKQKEQLILQTCYPPGTRQKRLLVFAEKVVANDLSYK